MTETKPFSLAAVLTITTDRLLCPFWEVYALCGHMTGYGVHTHQLPRIMHECRPWLLRWFPALGEINTRGLDTLLKRQQGQRAVEAWLARLLCDLPATYEVPPMPQGAHDRRDPLAELVEMVGPERVIVVQSNADTI